MQDKRYLGDAVYATHDGYHIWISTENGVAVTNSIALEPTVLAALDEYRSDLAAAQREAEADAQP